MKFHLFDSGLGRSVLGLMLVAFACPSAAQVGDRTVLKGTFLLGLADLDLPVSTSAYMPPESAAKPRNRFRGRLSLVAPVADGFAESAGAGGDRLGDPQLQIRKFPPFNAELVQDGNRIIPKFRGAQRGAHPYWELILEPGAVWDEPADKGYSRVAMPFSLRQRNRDCTHHGMLTFLFRDDGRTSRMGWQVVSETCLDFQADLWGVLEVAYSPSMVFDAPGVILRHRQNLTRRMPLKPISALANDYPGIDPAQFQPLTPEDTTVFGLVSDGVHYIGGCQTRFGPYPFCEQLTVPSYTTAASAFAGLAFMYLQQLYPGIAGETVTARVPECVLGDGRWDGVTLRNLVNMTTGVYGSEDFMADEDAIGGTAFIQGETHADKIGFACEAYTRQRDPGTWWAYHRSDSYIAGRLMDAFLEEQLGVGAEAFDTILVEEIWRRLELSAVAERSNRTYDVVAQAWTGYGLTFIPDDVARIGRFLNMDDGRINGQLLFDQREFAAAMQRSDHRPIAPLEALDLNFRNGFWAANAGAWVGCEADVWAPFMSGLGGITIALLPNDTVYYYFSDANEFDWAAAAQEANKIRSICGE